MMKDIALRIPFVILTHLLFFTPFITPLDVVLACMISRVDTGLKSNAQIGRDAIEDGGRKNRINSQ